MTDQERLEVIKRQWHEEDTLDFDEYDWLIEQAERVGKLVDRRVKDIQFVKEIRQQNQRYKQALESIKENSEDKMAVFVARKALEGGNENE